MVFGGLARRGINRPTTRTTTSSSPAQGIVTVTDRDKKPWDIAAYYLSQVLWQAEKRPRSEGDDPHRWDRRSG